MSCLVLLPGRNGKVRLYDRLRPFFPELITPTWIEPLPAESLIDYAHRMGETLRPLLPFTLGGTSFGGIVAHEMAPALGLETCLLISTVRTHEELRALPLPSPMPLSRTAFDAWSREALTTWQLSPAAARVQTYHLHGERDATFPLACVHPDEIIPGGGHVLPATHPAAVAAFLQKHRRS